MRHLTWEEYYDGFYDWAESTRRRYAQALDTFGPADEVAEVAAELAWDDERFAVRFVQRALDAGVRFSPEQVVDLSDTMDGATLGRMAETADGRFDAEQLDELLYLVDDATFERISHRSGAEGPDCEIWAQDEPAPAENSAVPAGPAPRRSRRLFAMLLGLLAGPGPDGGAHRAQAGAHCDGDCENCPPHYGYRYGRWYYGHGHTHGCERGGNANGRCPR